MSSSDSKQKEKYFTIAQAKLDQLPEQAMEGHGHSH
jgi:hypothetical protein